MKFDFLPDKIKSAIININFEKLYEIRLRTNFPIIVIFAGKRYFLCENGLTLSKNDAIIAQLFDINYILDKITESSIYAFNDKIKMGFITLENGIRVGLSGECVFENEKIVTIKNFSSLNIRIPHLINNCSKNISLYCLKKDIYNTLIISPPFCGKTTILKDLALKIDSLYQKNILIIDERGEFSCVNGQNIDKISYSNKQFAFNNGVRSLSPDIVITDELVSEDDWKCVFEISNCGVKIFASIHAENLENVINKKCFISNVFDRYIVLKKNNFGVIDSVYDRNFVKI